MATNVHNVVTALTPDVMADEIVTMWTNFKQARSSWEAEVIEIANYKYATSTRTTEVGQAGFKNSTTIPKLAHIAMNLQAIYEAHLFASPNWVQFEAFNQEATAKEQRDIVEAYVRTKVRRKDYQTVLGATLGEWIDTGACFAQQRYITETYTDINGDKKPLYQGTVLEKIPAQDIVFDVTATSFKKARKVIRKSYTLGDIAALVAEDNGSPFTPEILEEMRVTRMLARSSAVQPTGIDWKEERLNKDGFGSMMNYMAGDVVEVLEFYGDFYSLENGEFLQNYKIVVADRRKVIYKEAIKSRNGSQYIYYSGWEDRPNNLMGMSPLARLVGMQYKLDKLENQRADAFDLIIHPPIVERGDIQFFGVRGAPGSRYVTDEDGDVHTLKLDATVLNADFQMRQTMELMEEMAGSPRNSSGTRTPGEKTKFEVQFLDAGNSRLPRSKAAKFEREFIEPILNDCVELALDNMGQTDLISSESSEFSTEEFIAVSKDDLNVSGMLRARGSKLFAERATALQNIIGIFSSPVKDVIMPHTSRIKLAKALEELGDIKQYGLIVKNIGIQEDQESQQMMNQSQQTTGEVDAINAEEPLEGDVNGNT